MVAEPAHHLAGVAVIVGMAAVRRVQAQLAAFVHGPDVLVHRVDGFQDAAAQFLEFAQLGGLLDAVILYVVVAVGR